MESFTLLCKVHSGVGLGDNHHHKRQVHIMVVNTIMIVLTVIKSSVDRSVVAIYITNSLQPIYQKEYFKFQS